MRLTSAFGTLTVFVFLSLEPGEAGTRALLVGVSDYDNSFGISDLRGPVNDVRLLDRALRMRGVDDITLLTEGAVAPTKSAITTALADLALRAKAGDLVYVHLSGHGTQQKDQNGEEPDGLDEVFMPADVERGEPGSGVLVNALTDDEIGQALDAIRATGADVWLVMDSCHSGTGLRAASPALRTRNAPPELFGVDLEATGPPDDLNIESREDDLPGRILAFYSARSNELAHEYEFSGAGGKDWYGLFSAALASRMISHSGMTYRQLFQAVLSDINDSPVPYQTPTWDGDFIDGYVLGNAETSGVRRFPVSYGVLQAGQVHGLPEGTFLKLFSSASALAEDALGYAQIERADLTKGVLRRVDAGCLPAAVQLCPASGNVPPDARFAQIEGRPMNRVVRFAPPVDLATGAVLPEDHPAFKALRGAVSRVSASGRARVEITGDDLGVETAFEDGVLWFGEPVIVGGSPAGAAWASGAHNLDALVERIGRARDLAAMLASLDDGSSPLNALPIEVQAMSARSGIGQLAGTNETIPPRAECERARMLAGGDDWKPHPAQADLKQCDRLRFEIKGKHREAYDVNRIHIDAQYCVHVEYQRLESSAAAIPLGRGMTICSDCPGGYSAGSERVFVVVSRSPENAEALNLEGSLETCRRGAATRGAADQRRTSDFLAGLASRPNTRGSMDDVSVSGIWAQSFGWIVLPREEAFRRAGRETN
jgi:hypothetical protein